MINLSFNIEYLTSLFHPSWSMVKRACRLRGIYYSAYVSVCHQYRPQGMPTIISKQGAVERVLFGQTPAASYDNLDRHESTRQGSRERIDRTGDPKSLRGGDG